MPVRGHYGALPNDPSKPRVTLRRKPNSDLTPPDSVDWYSQVPASSWGMLGNGPDNSYAPGYQGCGDCTIASAGHIADQVAFFAQGKQAPVTSKQVVALYSALTGYNPNTGRNDTGAMLQDALNIWAKSGLAGYKPSGFAEIDVTDIDLLKMCIAEFGAVYSAFSVPASFESQFDAGQPWDVVSGRTGSQILGGHAVPLVGYDSQYIYALTWGAVQPVTWAAFNKYWAPRMYGEAWVAVLAESVEASGSTFEGIDTATANADFQKLTGSSESPFPSVTPPTPPTPPVPPVPPTADAVALLTSLQGDLTLAADQATQLAATIGAFLQANPPADDVPPHVHGH